MCFFEIICQKKTSPRTNKQAHNPRARRRLICSTFLPHLICSEMFWQAVKNQSPLLSNAIYFQGSCVKGSGWAFGLCQGAEQFPSKGCLSSRANAAREYFTARERGQEKSGESRPCRLQRELGERDATPNVIQMGDNLPTHSYLVFF